jgi:hypothetical protein
MVAEEGMWVIGSSCLIQPSQAIKFQANIMHIQGFGESWHIFWNGIQERKIAVYL